MTLRYLTGISKPTRRLLLTALILLVVLGVFLIKEKWDLHSASAVQHTQEGGTITVRRDGRPYFSLNVPTGWFAESYDPAVVGPEVNLFPSREVYEQYLRDSSNPNLRLISITVINGQPGDQQNRVANATAFMSKHNPFEVKAGQITAYCSREIDNSYLTCWRVFQDGRIMGYEAWTNSSLIEEDKSHLLEVLGSTKFE